MTHLQAVKIQYGLECFIYESIKIIPLFIVFSFFSLAFEFLVVLAYLITLRPLIGGYHAKSHRVCFAVSFVFFALVIAGGCFIELETVHKTAILLVSVGITLYYAPVNHINKPVTDPTLRRILKLTSVLALAISAIPGFALEGRYSNIAFLTMLAIMFMAVLGHHDYLKASKATLENG